MGIWIAEFLTSLFALWSLGFYLLMATFVIVMFWAIELGYGGRATMTMIVTALIVHYFSGVDLYVLVTGNPLWGGVLIGGYLLIGVGWSMIKWWSFTRNISDKCKEIIRKELIKRNLSPNKPIPPKLRGSIRDAITRRLDYSPKGDDLRPYASDYSSRIISWMGGWPFSMAWTIINDPVKRFFKYLFRRLKHFYDGISERSFRGVEDALKDESEPEEKPEDDGECKGRDGSVIGA
jgi:hypothetical protein